MNIKKIYILLFIFFQAPLTFEIFGMNENNEQQPNNAQQPNNPPPQQNQPQNQPKNKSRVNSRQVKAGEETDDLLEFAKKWVDNKTGSNIGWIYKMYGLTVAHKQELINDYYYNQGNGYGNVQISPEVLKEFNELYPTKESLGNKIIIDPVLIGLGKGSGKLGEAAAELLLKKLFGDELTTEQKMKHYEHAQDDKTNWSTQLNVKKNNTNDPKEQEKLNKMFYETAQAKERLEREGIAHTIGSSNEPAARFVEWYIKKSYVENKQIEKEIAKLENQESKYYENSYRINKKKYDDEDLKHSKKLDEARVIIDGKALYEYKRASGDGKTEVLYLTQDQFTEKKSPSEEFFNKSIVEKDFLSEPWVKLSNYYIRRIDKFNDTLHNSKVTKTSKLDVISQSNEATIEKFLGTYEEDYNNKIEKLVKFREEISDKAKQQTNIVSKNLYESQIKKIDEKISNLNDLYLEKQDVIRDKLDTSSDLELVETLDYGNIKKIKRWYDNSKMAQLVTLQTLTGIIGVVGTTLVGSIKLYFYLKTRGGGGDIGGGNNAPPQVNN